MKDEHRKILKEIGIYIPVVLLTLLIASNLYIGISKAVTGQPVPKVFGFSPLVVLSGSMEPALYPGDIVVIKTQQLDKYKIGDVVTYLDGRTVYTHRIIEQEDGMFFLKGDNNNAADDWVKPEQLEGKVLVRIPLVGRAIVFFKRPGGMALLGLGLLAFLYSDDLVRVKNKYLSK